MAEVDRALHVLHHLIERCNCVVENRTKNGSSQGQNLNWLKPRPESGLHWQNSLDSDWYLVEGVAVAEVDRALGALHHLDGQEEDARAVVADHRLCQPCAKSLDLAVCSFGFWWFKAQGSGDLGCRVKGVRVPRSGIWVANSKFRVPVSGFRLPILGSGFRVPSSEFRVPGSGCR